MFLTETSVFLNSCDKYKVVYEYILVHGIYSVPKLMSDGSRADETAHFIVKSVYTAMSTHIDQMPVQVNIGF